MNIIKEKLSKRNTLNDAKAMLAIGAFIKNLKLHKKCTTHLPMLALLKFHPGIC